MLKVLQRLFLLILVSIVIEGIAQESLQGGGCDVIFSLGDNDTLCTNSQLFPLPDAFPFGGEYSGPGVSNYSFDPSVTGVGQFEITYSYSDGSCSSSATVIMTVIEGTDLDIVGDFVICEGESTLLASGNGQEYTWADGSKAVFKEFSPLSTLNSFVSGVDPNGCNVTTDFTITVGTVPDATVSGETELCLGDTAHLTVSGATSWQWSTGSQAQSIDVIITSPETVELTIFGNNCDSIIPIYVSVLPYPDLVVDAPGFVCMGDTVTVVASGAATYRSFIGNFNGEFSFVANSGSNYFVEGFNENGCSTVQQMTLVVGQNSPITFTGPPEICSGVETNFEASGTAGFLWENVDEGSVIAEGAFPHVALSPTDTTNYRVTGINEVGCGESIDFTVIVHPLPVLSIFSPDPICLGKIVNLFAEGANEYLWNQSSSSNPYSFVASADEVVSMTGTTEFGCTSDITYDVHANPVPIVSITGASSICRGEAAVLTAFGADGYEWSYGAQTAQIVVYPQDDSLFYVTGHNEFGCTDFTTFSVQVRPSPSVEFMGPDTICAGDLFHLDVETDGSFMWSNGNVNAFVEFFPTGDSTLYVASEGPNGCVTTNYFTVTVNPAPNVVIEGDNEICAQETITLTASGATQYTWTDGGDGESITITPVFTSNVHLSALGENGCVAEVNYLITVHQLPYVYFQFSDDTICDIGPAFSWQANPTGGTYSGDGVVNNQFDPQSTIPGINTTAYSVTDEFNCTSVMSDSVLIDDCSGVNETASEAVVVYPNPADEMLIIESLTGKISEVQLFNSLGDLVFSDAAKNAGSRVIVSLADFAPGLYEVKFKNNDLVSASRKIVIR